MLGWSVRPCVRPVEAAGTQLVMPPSAKRLPTISTHSKRCPSTSGLSRSPVIDRLNASSSRCPFQPLEPSHLGVVRTQPATQKTSGHEIGVTDGGRSLVPLYRCHESGIQTSLIQPDRGNR